MTRTTIAKSFTIAALTALALTVAPTAKADDKGCSNASLTGTFGVTITGFNVYNVPAGTPFPPFAGVSMQTFDGKGGITNVGMSNSNGTVGQGTNAGTYTVNPDCTGTYTLVTRQGPNNWFFVLTDNWNEIRALCVDPYGVYTRIGRKLYPGRNM